MGYTLVRLQSNYDQELLALAAQAGLSTTAGDVDAALSGFWAGHKHRNATEVWEPSIANDDAFSHTMDRDICLRLGITDPTLHAEANRRSREIFHDPATFTIFPEVLDTLAALREAVPTLGILSNWDWWLPEMCETLGLTSYFDFIITSARVGAAKPHAAIFREALKQADVEPRDLIHVGDDLFADVRGAQASSITGVLLDRDQRAEPDDYPIINSLDELLALL
jgi:HAD superfamily hydrolase (TIGR01549 family)